MAKIQFPYSHDFREVENSEDGPKEIPAMPQMDTTNTSQTLSERMISTWGIACKTVRLLSYRYQNHWNGAIVHMNDHKGTLEITWRDHESRIMFEGVIVGAWEKNAECCASHTLIEFQ